MTLHEPFIFISTSNLFISKIIFLLISLDRLYLICQYPIGNYIHYRRLQWLIQRLFVKKRESFNQEAQRILLTLQQELSMPATSVTIYERYDIEHLDAKDLESAKNLIFSEPP